MQKSLKPLFITPSHNLSLSMWMGAAQAYTETVLSGILPLETEEPAVLSQALRYAVLGGGKRIRPLLALAAGELCGAVPMTALTVGCAVELIHAYSLVHDDMPCMDNDVLRRGKPTVHIQYGEATALLVGDGLQALAFKLLTQPLSGIESHTALNMVNVLATGAGGMVSGQQLDLLAENRTSPLALDALKTLHQNKTGALLSASVQLGALSGYAIEHDSESGIQDALKHYSNAIGLGFQIADDILDVTADVITLGKTPNKDINSFKSTYVTVLGLEQAKHAAQVCLNDALNALKPYGDRAKRLNELAVFMINREF